MLHSLSIRDFAIIEALELEFRAGFSAITGETGAGKSILVDALSLLLGRRAEPGLVAAGRTQAELIARFEIAPGHNAAGWLDEQAMNDGDSVLLRRVIPAEGASRAWINGRPATISQLRQLGEQLVEIHGQHEHQQLARTDAQRQWLDRHVAAEVLESVVQAWSEWRRIRGALDELEQAAGDERELEFLRFQLGELQELGLKAGEFAELEAEQKRLSAIDDLRAGIQQALEALDGDDPPGGRSRINQAVRSLEPLTGAEPQLEEILAMLGEARLNLDEACAGLNRQTDGLEADPERLDQVDRRLGRALDLARKHRIKPDRLADLALSLSARIDNLGNYEANRKRLQADLENARGRWAEAAADLTRARLAAAAMLEKRVAQSLAKLGMSEARTEFRIESDPDAGIHAHGADRVEIGFTANPGQPVQPLSRVASGGELSRLSLAMIIAGGATEPSRARVFDEIDAGVGGETAHAVGLFLKEAAAGGQAFCVTHLPQVAARADHQFQVLKRAADGATRVEVVNLDAETRKREIARMLGSSRSDRGLAHAEELLESVRDD